MSTFRNLIKIAALGAVVYGAYKYGKSVGNNNQPDRNGNPIPDIKNHSFQEIDPTESEIDYVLGLIQELKEKPNKTQKDRYTIELLEIKLNQLKNKK